MINFFVFFFIKNMSTKYVSLNETQTFSAEQKLSSHFFDIFSLGHLLESRSFNFKRII